MRLRHRGEYPPDWQAIKDRVRPLKRTTKTCRACGRDFTGYPSQMALRTHCSKQCQRRSTSYICEVCGATRTVRPSETAKRFCGDACRLVWFSQAFRGARSPHWRGGARDYYGPNWRRQRDAARNRDKRRCTKCAKHESQLHERLSVAHVVPFRLFGLRRYREANSLTNLLSMCRKCHIRHDWLNGHRT